MSNFKQSNRIKSWRCVFLAVFSCLATLFVVVLSGKYFRRTYAKQGEVNGLSNQTLEMMLALKHPLEIYATMENGEPGAASLVRKDIARLLNEYADCAHGNTVKIEFDDLAGIRAKNLVEPTIFLPTNSILLKYAERRKVVAIEELYDVHNGEVVGFRGERILTNAIRDLTFEKKKIIYFLTGHGEYDVTDVSVSYGLSTLANILRSRGYEVKIFNFGSGNIPEDANLLVLWGPRLTLLPSEVLSLSKFLDERGGRIIIGLGSANDAALIEFLADHGIYADVRTKIFPFKNSSKISHDLVASGCVEHGITGELINFKAPVVCGETHEVREADWVSNDDKFFVTELLRAEGISNYTEGSQEFTVVAMSEKQTSIAVDILAGKLLVFGCSDFATNARINMLGNRMLFCGAVDYMCDADNTIDIVSRSVDRYRLAFTDGQRHLITILNCAICCCFIVAGVVAYLIRTK